MTQRTRALRRHQSQRAKARAINHLQTIFGESREWITPQKIAEYAKNRTPCSCWMCGNPRRFTGEATRQELKAVCDRDGN